MLRRQTVPLLRHDKSSSGEEPLRWDRRRHRSHDPFCNLRKTWVTAHILPPIFQCICLNWKHRSIQKVLQLPQPLHTFRLPLYLANERSVVLPQRVSNDVVIIE